MHTINRIGQPGLVAASEAAFDAIHSAEAAATHSPGPDYGSASLQARGQSGRLAGFSMDYVAEHGLPETPAQVRALLDTVGSKTERVARESGRPATESTAQLRGGAAGALGSICDSMAEVEGLSEPSGRFEACHRAIEAQLDLEASGPTKTKSPLSAMLDAATPEAPAGSQQLLGSMVAAQTPAVTPRQQGADRQSDHGLDL